MKDLEILRSPGTRSGAPPLRVIRTPNTRSITTTLSSSTLNHGSASAGDTTCKPFAASTRTSRELSRPANCRRGRPLGHEYVITYDGRRVNTVSIIGVPGRQGRTRDAVLRRAV